MISALNLSVRPEPVEGQDTRDQLFTYFDELSTNGKGENTP